MFVIFTALKMDVQAHWRHGEGTRLEYITMGQHFPLHDTHIHSESNRFDLWRFQGQQRAVMHPTLQPISQPL